MKANRQRSCSYSPKQRYQSLIDNNDVVNDAAQHLALAELDELYYQLNQPAKEQSLTKGVYLWGKVGRGKTFLMDLFSSCLRDIPHLRLHFHHFMADIHHQLHHVEGHANPLKLVAHKISKRYKVLCFDEFFVSDIGDAMLLGKLLHYLFHNNVTLVATSNIPPEELYKDGLQRARFIPAIEEIISNTTILSMEGQRDHRERELQHKQIYFIESAKSPAIEQQRHNVLNKLLPGYAYKDTPDFIEVLGRNIPCVVQHKQMICFNFSALCEGPRSHLDYINIAHRFSTVLIVGLPPLGGNAYEHIKARGTEDGVVGSRETGEREIILTHSDDAARRFIAVIDEFYERKVKLYLTGQCPIEQLYPKGCLLFAFERVRSRLKEMASLAYFELPHRP